jgi:hypothetical protein
LESSGTINKNIAAPILKSGLYIITGRSGGFYPATAQELRRYAPPE